MLSHAISGKFGNDIELDVEDYSKELLSDLVSKGLKNINNKEENE